MKLYFSPGACSLASHIALNEIGKPFEIEKVDFATRKTASGKDFKTISPNGYVPAVEVAPGEVLTEGAAILQYLADAHPDARLAPASGTLARARTNELLTFISSELHKGFSPLFNPAITPEAREATIAKLNTRFARVETILGDGRAYLTGDSFTVADAYLFTVANWAGVVKVDLSAYPKLNAFQARVAARPAVKAAMGAEGLLAA
jgi:glutathione S-transferase